MEQSIRTQRWSPAALDNLHVCTRPGRCSRPLLLLLLASSQDRAFAAANPEPGLQRDQSPRELTAEEPGPWRVWRGAGWPWGRPAEGLQLMEDGWTSIREGPTSLLRHKACELCCPLLATGAAPRQQGALPRGSWVSGCSAGFLPMVVSVQVNKYVEVFPGEA